MIENVGLSIYPDKDGFSVVYFDIIYNGETYHWEDHIKSFGEKSLSEYLNDHLNDYIEEIIEKEMLWENSPHTRLDGEGNEVEINKNEVVSPNAPSRKKLLEKMKKETELIIDEKMPQWRLNRWRRYYDLYQKVLLTDLTSLNEIELIEYESFPDPGETHQMCQQYVPLALKWCADCINTHKLATIALYQSTTLDELLSASNIVYPEWPL